MLPRPGVLPEGPMDGRIRVLVVDDEAGLRRFLAQELTARGFAVDSAGSGEEGLRKIAEAVYDVVLLDMKMPGMDGLAALREIRREAPAPEVLILTGQGSVESAVQAMRAGAFHYITKPFHLEELEVQIRRRRTRASSCGPRAPSRGPSSGRMRRS